MSEPLNADDELREILSPEFLDSAGAKEEHFYPALNKWRNKQIEAVLDRLYSLDNGTVAGARDVSEAIEAERNRLKSGMERLKELNITAAGIDSVEYFGDPPTKLKESK